MARGSDARTGGHCAATARLTGPSRYRRRIRGTVQNAAGHACRSRFALVEISRNDAGSGTVGRRSSSMPQAGVADRLDLQCVGGLHGGLYFPWWDRETKWRMESAGDRGVRTDYPYHPSCWKAERLRGRPRHVRPPMSAGSTESNGAGFAYGCRGNAPARISA